MSELKPLIIGGGPAGLAAALELTKHSLPVVLLERDLQVGGLCKTTLYKGFRFDIGGHRFFTKNKEVQDLWNSVLGEDFLLRQRLSRIYYRNKFFHYPLKIGSTLKGLGLYDSSLVLLSYLKAQLFPRKPEKNFEEWVSNRFGFALYSIFFKTYTEKVWGVPCVKLSADWAAQRIRNLSLKNAVLQTLGVGKEGNVASLIEKFHYPRLGPGQMYERMAELVSKQGGRIHSEQDVVEVSHQSNRIKQIRTWSGDGRHSWDLTHCFSSMPITELVLMMRPLAPDQVLDAAMALRYRSIITVNLLLNRPALLPDNWIYLHSTEVRAGRLQVFKNWSPHMVPPGEKSSISFEYFCFENDELWNSEDASLIELAKDDLYRMGLLSERDEVVDGFVAKYAKAYPMYENSYQKYLSIVREWLSQFDNLFCIGRYGQFRYNNMDHSIITGMLAVRRLLGEPVDPWSVNAEAEYLEELKNTSRLIPSL